MLGVHSAIGAHKWHLPKFSRMVIVIPLDELGITELVAAGKPETILFSICQMMCLPTHYAPFLLKPSRYTLFRERKFRYPSIMDANKLGSCAALLKWL